MRLRYLKAHCFSPHGFRFLEARTLLRSRFDSARPKKRLPWFGGAFSAGLQVAVHVRRGDMTPGHPAKRFQPVAAWLEALESLTDAIAQEAASMDPEIVGRVTTVRWRPHALSFLASSARVFLLSRPECSCLSPFSPRVLVSFMRAIAAPLGAPGYRVNRPRKGRQRFFGRFFWGRREAHSQRICGAQSGSDSRGLRGGCRGDSLGASNLRD